MIFLINDNPISASVKILVVGNNGLDRTSTAFDIPAHGVLETRLTELNLPGNHIPNSLLVESTVELVGIKLELTLGCFQELIHLASSFLIPIQNVLEFRANPSIGH